MSIVEIATVTALPVSAITLTIVIYQAYLTRKALDLTQKSLDLTHASLDAARKSMDAATRSNELAIRTMQIKMLPSANWVIQVRVALEQWSADLESVIETALVAQRQHDEKMIHDLATAGLRTPKGFIRRFDAEHTPEWLSTIWFTGTQYFYDAKAPQTSLWNETENKPWFEFVPDFITRCKESINGIKQLLKMIDDVVPAAYLGSPASLSDERFLD